MRTLSLCVSTSWCALTSPMGEQIMQYGARFFFWWFATTDPALSQRAFKLYRTTQRSRKAFRMLKVQ